MRFRQLKQSMSEEAGDVADSAVAMATAVVSSSVTTTSGGEGVCVVSGVTECSSSCTSVSSMSSQSSTPSTPGQLSVSTTEAHDCPPQKNSGDELIEPSINGAAAMCTNMVTMNGSIEQAPDQYSMMSPPNGSVMVSLPPGAHGVHGPFHHTHQSPGSPHVHPRPNTSSGCHSPDGHYASASAANTSPDSRSNSPSGNSGQNGGQNAASAPQQHVVHVHVNPGETFSVRVGDQIQHIQGPATVRMVSNSGPPMPMPMQVPPGHMVHQIVDENGILTHVILSPQPPGMAAQPMTVGYYPNGTPSQMYGGPSYPPSAAGAGHYYQQATSAHHPYTSHPSPQPPPGGPHMHGMGPPGARIHTTPPPGPGTHQCSNHAPIPPQGGGSHTGSGALDERTARAKARLQVKLNRRPRQDGSYYHNNRGDPISPRRAKTKHSHSHVNGDTGRQSAVTVDNGSGCSSSGESNGEMEEEQKMIRDVLSKIHQPSVTEIGARSALIRLTAPEVNQQELTVDPAEFRYELLIWESKKENKYNTVYSGEATEITLKDLTPATEYHLKVICVLDDVKGESTEAVKFQTEACEPDTPALPKLASRTKTSLLLKWNATADNGAKITSYVLESDQGRGDKNYVEIYSGVVKQYKVTKLSASTGYRFRLSAINSIGRSKASDTACYYTNGSVPSQPDPPMLSEQYVRALIISWIRRPNDDEFMLQMEDGATGHGFLTVYNGPDLSFKILNLRRNTEYKFRLQASNEEGSSRWSDAVAYKTLPDRPAPPPKPHVKGKIHARNFILAWDSPKDTGGSDVTAYTVEMDAGRGYELIYEGTEMEFFCDHLLPGYNYRLRVSCQSAGGMSEWSDVLSVTTLPVPPGPCSTIKVHNKPRATSLQLKWVYPDYTGGAAISEFNVLQKSMDNSTREVYAGRDLECTVAGLLPGRPYLFQVRALNKAGAGPWSEVLEVVTGPGVPDPPKPPTVHCRSPHSATVTWEEPVNNGATVTDYRLEWQNMNSDSDFSQLYYGSSVTHEARGLAPDTTYAFRVQALNSAGASAFSSVTECVSPPSSPGAVVSVRASTTPTSVHLTWKSPAANGSPIHSYNIEVGGNPVIPVDAGVNEYTIDDLSPETTYKLRVQAVNGIGVGPFSSPIKVTTRALPPSPPHLECVSIAPNCLKLKWGDGRNADLLQYCLEMQRENGSFHPIYQNTGHTYKVNKLSELTEYVFRIYASNEAGDGPYSQLARFQTSKAPPPAVKAPSIVETGLDWCQVSWTPVKPMARDSILYLLQLHSPNQEYTQVYRGSDVSFTIKGLHHKTEYQVRVCAIRIATPDPPTTADSTSSSSASSVATPSSCSQLIGAYSPGVSFTTLSPRPTVQPSTSTSHSSQTSSTERIQITDQQWACIFLLCFALCAVVFAFLAQQIITYTSGGDSNAAAETINDSIHSRHS